MREIVQELRRNDKNALERLFRNNYLKLVTYATKLCNNKKMAESIAKHVFVSIWDERESLPQKVDWGTYLFQQTHFYCRAAFNADKHDANSVFLPSKALANKEYHPHLREECELEHRVFQAISSLPANEKNLLLMNRFEGVSFEKIAQTQGMEIAEVEKVIASAVEKLHKQLEADIPVILTISMLSFIIS
ncbi:sigma-70 family RNA polymerase sigma factor [Flammeovirgaceae bacterium SG7u.111]|nr:sigma-70 family RNA polymerase sigma factor [Flammeovirgaceae bacterium SG7u.132]WPO36057.1 sigma-70 family RNA polymerase sigma factor [Flammeovirgaceae bacterium SG7u.111]